MTNILPAKCCTNGEEFEIVLGYEKGRLTMIEGRKIRPRFGTKSHEVTRTMNLSDGIVSGNAYHCPVCRNTRIVRCGKCGRITCYDGSGSFTCAWCKNSGNVKGTIKSIDIKKDPNGQGGFVQ